MEEKFVNSTNILKIGYESKLKQLEITFINNRLYRYHGVPEELFRQFLISPSKGRFFSTYINKRYQYERVR